MVSDKQTYITKKGLSKLEDELNDLKTVKRMQVSERIAAAKEFGDLSENAEYTEAKSEQGFIEGRVMELETILRNVVIIEEDLKSEDGVVSVGSKLKIKEVGDAGKGMEQEFHIVGSHEADPGSGRISNESPIGKALLGAKLGEVVEINLPKGTLKCEVVEVK